MEAPISPRSDPEAEFGYVLATNYHPVTIADRRFDHRVAMYLEHKEFAIAGKTGRDGENVLYVLLGINGGTGSNLSYQGNRVMI